MREEIPMKPVIFALSIALATTMIVAASTSTTVALHNCSVEGHTCEVKEVIKEVVKRVNCPNYNDLRREDLTVSQWAVLTELHAAQKAHALYSTREKLLVRLENLQKSKKTHTFIQKKHALDLIKAMTAKTEAENTKEKLAQQWLNTPLSIGLEDTIEKQKQMEEKLQRLSNMRLLALAIRQQHVEMMNAVKDLEVEGTTLEIESNSFGGGGKYGSKSIMELKIRELDYFGK